MNDLPKNEWMDQWQAMSRQYWSAWQDLSREAGMPGARDPASVPWHEGFEQWSRMFGANPTGSQSETVERVLASAKSFTAFAQSMIAAATGAGGATPNWSDAMRQGFNTPGGGAAAMFDNPVAHALREISGQGTKSFEQMMANFAPYLGQAGFGQGAFDPAREAKSWLGVPAFGFLREHQEHYQKMAVALIEYQEQNGRYNTLILKASKRGFELFESKLAAREEPGRQIDSLRALYDLWVDAAEEAYAEVALSQEFREVYGALVNAQMRMRSQFQQEIERIATDLGMPTRSELDSIGQRLQEVRREMRRGGNADSSALAGEVAALRREVGALKAALAKTAQPSAAASKPMASASRPVQHKRPRATTAKKSAPKVAALKADIRESVRTLDGDAKSTAPKRPRRAKKAPTTHVQRAGASPRTKKSVAKVAHVAIRVGNPVQSFAARMAEFARSAQRAHPRKPARANRRAKSNRRMNKPGGR
jgi:class III poly(R)-hydroxyalkanoic acid synthase PhaE subunit